VPRRPARRSTARNRVFADARRSTRSCRAGLRAAANEFERLLGHCGFALEPAVRPGRPPGVYARAWTLAGRRRRAARRRSRPRPRPARRGPVNCSPSPRALPVTTSERSERFFATLPRKVIAASVICRADDGRLLLVYDAFKRHWTIPGGVVDPDESPRDAAEREAWEETGIRSPRAPHAGHVRGVVARPVSSSCTTPSPSAAVSPDARPRARPTRSTPSKWVARRRSARAARPRTSRSRSADASASPAGPGTYPRRVKHVAASAAVAALVLLPEPQGHGSLRPTFWSLTTVSRSVCVWLRDCSRGGCREPGRAPPCSSPTVYGRHRARRRLAPTGRLKK
jgi:ADP-ribose pyrophosphatase YjhB (NUDIX family)